MVNPVDPKDEIIRDPENYAEMIKKLEERQREGMERATRKLGSEDIVDAGKLLEGAKKELDQLRGRRDFKPLSSTEKERKTDPTDPHVLEVLSVVTALSHRIDVAIKQDPQANRAVLRGRVTLGNPEGKPGVAGGA